MLVGWIIGILAVLLLLYGLSRLGKPREFSEEEFDRESKRPSLMRTGLQEFHGFLEPEKKAALEVVKEEKRKTDQHQSGDPPSY